jgi:hypothetical protein
VPEAITELSLFWRRAMMMGRLFLVLVSAVLLCTYALPAQNDGLKSGPQAGDNLPGPFHSLVAYGEDPSLVGKKTDFSEMYGQAPVVLVFARDITRPLTKLLNKLDVEAAKHKAAKLRVIVVFLSDNDALENNLKEYGKQQAIKHVNLAIMEPDGPKLYRVSKEAEVTVVMYKRRKVEGNHAFKKGELTERSVEKIVRDVPKITFKR